MATCFNDRLLFIHIPKCAGLSVETYVTAAVPGMTKQGFPIGHIRLQDVERFTGRTPDSFEMILAVIRNPYARELSQWRFWQNRFQKGGRHIHDCIAAVHSTLTAFLLDPMSEFGVWYEHQFGPAADRPDRSAWLKYWITHNGKIPPNVQIVKFEEMDKCLPALIEPFASTTATLERLNVTPGTVDWHDYYRDPITRALVERKYEWAFGEHYKKWNDETLA